MGDHVPFELRGFFILDNLHRDKYLLSYGSSFDCFMQLYDSHFR